MLQRYERERRTETDAEQPKIRRRRTTWQVGTARCGAHMRTPSEEHHGDSGCAEGGRFRAKPRPLVAQTGSLLYRGLATRRRTSKPPRLVLPAPCRLSIGDTADCQSALRWRAETRVGLSRVCIPGLNEGASKVQWSLPISSLCGKFFASLRSRLSRKITRLRGQSRLL